MKRIERTTQFKKDVKKYLKRTAIMAKLLQVVQMLEQEMELPPQMRPHRLQGNYRGFMECHVENDTLLIWFDHTSDVIKLVRFGSHSELFG